MLSQKKKKKSNKEEDLFYDPEIVFLEDIELAPLNNVYAPLSRFSEDGHSWNGKSYINYTYSCEDI
jgi:hypothetical protein